MRISRTILRTAVYLAAFAMTPVLLAGTPAGHVLVSATYDDANPAGWREIGGVNPAIAFAADPGDADRSIHLSSSCATKGDRGQFGVSFVRQVRPFALELKLKGTIRNRFYIRSTGDQDAFNFGYNDRGEFYVSRGADAAGLGGGDRVVKKDAAGAWLAVQFDVDMEAQAFDAFVDGEKVLAAAPFVNRVSNIASMKIKQYEKTASETGAGVRSIFVSQLMIRSSIEPRAYAKLLLTGQIAGARDAVARAGDRASAQKRKAMADAITAAEGLAGSIQAKPEALLLAESRIDQARSAFLAIDIAGPADYVRLVRAYADAMIAHGRDDQRYGEKTSPLFATALRRDTPVPQLLPYPQFFKNSKPVPGHLWNFCPPPDHGFYNIPKVGEDSHKQTVSGDDPHDQLGLYRALYMLTELTGEPKYRNAVDEALTWFFDHTQNPRSGLYPWGEHLGWDFWHDYPRYFVPGHEDFADPARRYREPTYNGKPIVTEMY